MSLVIIPNHNPSVAFTWKMIFVIFHIASCLLENATSLLLVTFYLFSASLTCSLVVLVLFREQLHLWPTIISLQKVSILFSVVWQRIIYPFMFYLRNSSIMISLIISCYKRRNILWIAKQVCELRICWKIPYTT